MKIIDQRYLDGANRYCTEPCLLSILDLGHPTPFSASDMQNLRMRLKNALPGLRQGRSLIGVVGDDVDAPGRGLQLARLIQSVAIELHRLTGDEVMMGFVGGVPKMPGRYRLILPFRCGTVAHAALVLAIRLVDGLLARGEFALDEGLAELRGIAAAGAPSPASIRIAA